MQFIQLKKGRCLPRRPQAKSWVGSALMKRILIVALAKNILVCPPGSAAFAEHKVFCSLSVGSPCKHLEVDQVMFQHASKKGTSRPYWTTLDQQPLSDTNAGTHAEMNRHHVPVVVWSVYRRNATV